MSKDLRRNHRWETGERRRRGDWTSEKLVTTRSAKRNARAPARFPGRILYFLNFQRCSPPLQLITIPVRAAIKLSSPRPRSIPRLNFKSAGQLKKEREEEEENRSRAAWPIKKKKSRKKRNKQTEETTSERKGKKGKRQGRRKET